MPDRMTESVHTRVPGRVKRELEATARERGVSPLSLARTLLDEGVRRERHPGITFRGGPAGRRPALEGRRLDVWQVMETLWASDGSITEAAEYLGLRPDQVEAAVSYYAAYRDEVDAWIARNREEADELEARDQRERAAMRR